MRFILCLYYFWYWIDIFNILRENLLGDSKIIRSILRSYLSHSKTRETWIPLKYLFNWIFNPLILLHQEDRIKKKIEHIVGWIDWINSVLYSFCSAMLLLPFVWKRTKPQLKFLPSRYLRVFEYSIRLDTINQ